jgi:hypothetical protein
VLSLANHPNSTIIAISQVLFELVTTLLDNYPRKTSELATCNLGLLQARILSMNLLFSLNILFFFTRMLCPTKFLLNFLMIAQAHVVSFQFSMNLNHKQCSNTIVAVNKDHKKNNHAQDTRSYPEKTLLKQGKNPTILCYRVKRR